MIDLAIRIKNPRRFEQAMIDLGLTKTVVLSREISPETGEVISEEAEEQYGPRINGVNVTDLGIVYKVAPKFDEDGTLTNTPKKAPGRHYNIRIDNPAIEAKWVDFFNETTDKDGNTVSPRKDSLPEATANKGEKAYRYKSVEFLDMTTVATPTRVWL